MTAGTIVIDRRETEGRAHATPELIATIRAARDGDAAAFEALMILTERRVAQVAWRMLGDAEEVKEAMQETFLRFFRHVRRFDETQDLSAWMTRITVNVCRDALKRRKRSSIFEPLDEMAPPADVARPADEELVQRGNLALLGRAIDALPPKERMAIVMRDVEGMRTSEVARALGNSVATVRVQLSRARLKLRRFIERARGETR